MISIKKYFILGCLLLSVSVLFLSCESKKQDIKNESVSETKTFSEKGSKAEPSIIGEEKEEEKEEEKGVEKEAEQGEEKEEDSQKKESSLDESKQKEVKNYEEEYKKTGELPSLSKVYEDSFRVGVALAQFDIENPKKAALVASQFNSITCENEMKADFTLDYEATLALADEEFPVVNMKRAEKALLFAKENGLQMRGHTLVWHSQTPRWLFAVGYDNSPEAPFVTRDTMLLRMEHYIKQEIEYVNENYPGIIYAWDVVNEAIDVGDGQENGIRIKDNYWYEVIGEDYIEKAFEYARKYATPEQTLFYNDYGTYEKTKMFAIYNLLSKLKEKNLVDGMGMQNHIQLTTPSILDYQYAINKYGELGIEIHITELDISSTDNSEESLEKLAIRYRTVVSILLNCIKKETANITSVTFWGLTDDRSWLNKTEEPNYPLLFDKDLQPKRAFFGVLQDSSVGLY